MDPTLIFFFLALIFSIIIHEVSHGFAAELLGDPTARREGRLTLNPIPHIDPIGSILLPGIMVLTNSPLLFGWAKPVPYNPYNLRNQRWGEAIVSGAGPGVNIALALGFALIVRFGMGALPTSFVALAAIVVYINILLALFNLLPIPPLDGSKLLKAILPYRAGLRFQQFEALLMQGGIIGIFLFLFLAITIIGPAFHSFVSFVFALLTGVPLAAVM